MTRALQVEMAQDFANELHQQCTAADMTQGEVGLMITLFLATAQHPDEQHFKAYVLDTMMMAHEFRMQIQGQADA